MRLQSISYKENETKHNPWELDDLQLQDVNLIVGNNAAGKSRTIRVIHNLTRIIGSKTALLNGEWKLLLKDKTHHLEYELCIQEGSVLKEKIIFQNQIMLDRNKNKAHIFSQTEKDMISIHPPNDRLVLHIRRDTKEYPFLEYMINWATTTSGFKFGDTIPGHIDIPGNPQFLETLNSIPTVIENIEKQSLQQAIKEFNTIGYDIEDARISPIPGKPISVKILQIKEKYLNNFINQYEVSNGMFRAFSLLVIIQHLIDKGKTETILVDDLCEGMDYSRGKNYAKLIFEKVHNSQIQFIATTNDQFLMNHVDIKKWNILYRNKMKVHAFNYVNSKEVFDEFRLLGLNNFDIFTSSELKKLCTKKQ